MYAFFPFSPSCPSSPLCLLLIFSGAGASRPGGGPALREGERPGGRRARARERERERGRKKRDGSRSRRLDGERRERNAHTPCALANRGKGLRKDGEKRGEGGRHAEPVGRGSEGRGRPGAEAKAAAADGERVQGPERVRQVALPDPQGDRREGHGDPELLSGGGENQGAQRRD